MRKKAIVTGASRGIGKGIAMCLAEEGYDLAISYVSKKEEADKVVEQISETYHTRCFAYQAALQEPVTDRKSTRLNSSHVRTSRMPSSA